MKQNIIMNKRTSKKLLAAFAVIAMATCIFCVVSPVDAEDETPYNPGIIILNNATALHYSSDEVNDFILTGYVGHNPEDTVFTAAENAGGWFKGVEEHAYVNFDVGSKIDTSKAVTIVQYNSALSTAYPDTIEFANDIKTKEYEANAFGEDTYCFLIPLESETNRIVTLEVIQEGETETFTFDFSQVEYVSYVADILNGGTTVTLTEDVIAAPIRITGGDYTFNLGNFTLATGSSASIWAPSGTGRITINAEATGGVFSNGVAVGTNTGSVYDVTIDGGIYAGGSGKWNYYGESGYWPWDTLTFYGSGTIAISNVTSIGVDDRSSGIWFGNNVNESVTLTNSSFYGCIGAYLGTVGITNISGCYFESKDNTAIEIKSGTVTIDDGTEIVGDCFGVSDGNVNVSGSGSGYAPLNINNGYANGAVSVTLKDATISNKSDSPFLIQIADGIGLNNNISFTADTSYGIDEMSIVDLGDGNITVKTGTYDQKDVVPATDLSNNTVEETLASGDIIVIQNNATPSEDSLEVSAGTSVVIPEGTTIEQDFTVPADDGSAIVISGGTYSGTITTGTGADINTVTFTGITGNFTITKGSILIKGVIANGTASISGDGKLNGDLVIDAGSTLEIDGDSTLDLNGYTLTINGTLDIKATGKIVNDVNTGVLNINSALSNINSGTIENSATMNIGATGILTNSGVISNNGTINVAGKIDGANAITNNGIINSTGGTIVTAPTGNPVVNGFGIGVDMDAVASDLPLSGYAFLQSDLTIPGNKSITVGPGATLDLNGYTLTVKGTLNVEVGGQVIGMAINGAENVIEIVDGTVINYGTIGVGTVPVTVKVGTSSVSFLNVEGIEFEVVKVGGVKTLAISGYAIAAVGSYTDNVIGVNGAQIGDLTISADVVMDITGTVVLMKDATLDVDGTINKGTIEVSKGATVIVDGTITSTISAETGAKETADTTTDLGTSSIVLDGVTGITVTVGTESYTKNVAGTPTAFTATFMYVDGTLKLIDETAAAGSMTVSNATSAAGISAVTEVAADTTLVIPAKITVDGAGTIVNGTVQYVDDTKISGFLGAKYAVETDVSGAKTTTYFIKPFEAAFAEIVNAKNNTITVLTGTVVDVKEGFTLADKQILVIQTGAEMNILDGAEVILQSGSRITGTVNEVEGIMKVERGASAAAPNKYAVFSQGTDGSKTYSGFIAAIENSTAGDKITVVAVGYTPADKLEVKGNVTIPADRTVIIQKDMTFKNNLVIEEGATVTNQAVITMSSVKATIDVAGVLDCNNAAANILFSGDDAKTDVKDRNINVTGELRLDAVADLTLLNATSTENAKINGAYYFNDDGVLIVTTVSKAVIVAADVTVIGTVTEYSDITVNSVDNIATLTIGITNLPATVALGEVTLDNSSVIVAANGTLTASIVGAYGIEGSTTDAQIDVVKAINVTFQSSSAPNSLAETVWKVSVDSATLTGAYNFVSGEVELANANTTLGITAGDALTVSSGAVLIVPATKTLDIGDDKTVIDGTIRVLGDLNIVDSIVIPGNLDIQKGGDLDVNGAKVLTLLGSIAVDEDATAVINGRLTLGEAPKTLGADASVIGKITVVGNIVVYNGSIDGAVLIFSGVEAKGTQFVINEIPYATVFGAGKITILDDEILALEDLNATTIDWYSGEDEIADTTTIGTYAILTATIKYQTVDVLTSVGKGISLAVDGVIVPTNTSLDLTIGKHQVSAVVEPGYKGDIAIAFNGVVVDGSFEITSDMVGETITLSATGAITTDSTVVVTPSEADGGMSLTDILLIVLVVLILIMAVIVAMRLMRN